MHFQKNYLSYTVAGVFLTIACLLALSAIPAFDIAGYHFKRIQILADVIKKEPPKVIAVDTIKPVKPVFSDTCKRGIQCFEDYTPDTSGMKAFLSALDLAGKQHVRIAWFSDSYVEGDIMLDPLRDTMQAIFGGSGVGWLPITSEVADFRETVRQTFSNWKTYSIVGDKDEAHPLGFSGYCFSPENGNSVLYRAIRRKRLNEFKTAKIFYGNCSDGCLVTNDDTIKISESKAMQVISISKPSESFKLSVPDGTQADLYGVSFEDKTGISIDNFSVRGNSGIGLAYVNEKMYQQLERVHPYDLVVLSYGLNVASDKAKNYDWYKKGMAKVIAMIKESFPNSSILLIGCSDRGAKIDGELETMPMLKELVEVQRQLAADNQICFWNLFDAMGGDSTMVNWANMDKHPYANKDYTHLTFYGGKKVASIFLQTVLYEKEKYDRKRKTL